MKAITDKYGLEESVCIALAAGIDMIIIGNNLEYEPNFLKQVIPVIIQAVQEKRISESHLLSAWKRIQRMKEQLAMEK
jgi:beta-N-acetylhexosaminidase